MTVSLSELIAQREALDRQIRNARDTDRSAAVVEIRRLMAEHGLTGADIASKSVARPGAKTGKPVAPKYRDPATGASWSGRGLKPKWLSAAISSGKRLEDFAI